MSWCNRFNSSSSTEGRYSVNKPDSVVRPPLHSHFIIHTLPLSYVVLNQIDQINKFMQLLTSL